MRVFVTGASGFVGTAVVQDLIKAGHTAIGLALARRQERLLISPPPVPRCTGATSRTWTACEVEPTNSDGVIHCGFVHDFTRFQEVCDIDRRAIEMFGETFWPDPDKPLGRHLRGRLWQPRPRSTRDRGPLRHQPPQPPDRLGAGRSIALAARGVRVSVVRLPQVHNTLKQGLVTYG